MPTSLAKLQLSNCSPKVNILLITNLPLFKFNSRGKISNADLELQMHKKKNEIYDSIYKYKYT